MSPISSEQNHQIVIMEKQIAQADPQTLENLSEEIAGKLLNLDLFSNVRDFEETATRLSSASKLAPQAFLNSLKNKKHPDDQAVALGILASIGFRRMGRRTASLEALDLIQGSRIKWAAFEGFCDHLRATAILGSGHDGLKVARQLSLKAIKKLPGHSGSLHTLANVELELAMLDHSAPEETHQLLKDALQHVNEAIELTDWPKFHFTKGRVLLRLANSAREVDVAMEELRLAAELESKDSFDSEERRLRYALERSIAEIRIFTIQSEKLLSADQLEQVRRFQVTTEKIERQMEERVVAESRSTQAQIISVVAFITGIFALLPGAAAIWSVADRALSENKPIEIIWLIGGVVFIAVTIWGAVGIAALGFNRQTRKVLAAIRKDSHDPLK